MAERPIIQALRAVVGERHVVLDPVEQARYLQDNSWLSPILSRHLPGLAAGSGQHRPEGAGVDAVVAPGDVAELAGAIAAAVRLGVAMTVRGGGTSNFGQSLALQGGVVIDATRLDAVLDAGDAHVTAQAGALCGQMQRQARAHGRDLTLLTTTYATATIGGWIAGGHVGIGSTAYGTIWDGNVAEVELLTAEDPPRRLTLRGDDVFPVLHSYGTVGVITRATVPAVPAGRWVEGGAVFRSFADACRFVLATGREPLVAQRVVAAQEAPLPSAFTPWTGLVGEADAAVALIVDEGLWDRLSLLAEHHGGNLFRWRDEGEQQKLSLTYFVYGHRMLWAKRLAPEAAFLHVYYHPGRVLQQLKALHARFASRVWLELKFINSPYLKGLFGWQDPGPVAAGVLTLTGGDPELLATVMAFCKATGIRYWNPHTFVLEESGLFSAAGFARIVACKRETDPRGLLNPGKIGATFFAAGGGGAGGDVSMATPEPEGKRGKG